MNVRGDVHDFLLPTEHQRYDRAETAVKLRQGIDALPETAATFKPKDFMDARRARTVSEGMITLMGSWKIPPVYSAGSGGARYVNPHYPGREVYSDVYAECKCGALMVREELVGGTPVSQGEHQHAEDCRKQWRYRAKARLLEKRRSVMLRCYWHGLSGAKMAERLGFKAPDSVGRISSSLGVSAEERRQAGQNVMAETMARLLQYHPPSTVGEVYGLSGQAVRANVARRTDTTPAELYEQRRAAE